MTELCKRGRKIAASGTVIFSLIFLLLCIFVKFEQKNDFKEIQITLDSTPVKEIKKTADVPEKSDSNRNETKKTEETKAPEKPVEPVKSEQKLPEKAEEPKKTEPVKKVEEIKKPEPVKKTVEPKKSDTVKSEVKKTEDTKPKLEEPALVKSIDDLMKEQSAPKKKKEVNWDELFGDETVVESVSSNNSQPRTAVKSSLSGSAGSSVEKESSSASSSSSEADRSSSQASSSTMSALEGIKNTSYTASISDNVKSKTSIASKKSSDGKVTIRMNNGTARELLSPKNPSIYISDENAHLIDTTKEVKIVFQVMADGTVPLSSISIKPTALLPSVIQNEIKEQLKSWRFSEDLTGGVAVAGFDYTIQVGK